MSKKLDLTGKRFNSLMVKYEIEHGKWLCMCDCGRETVVFTSNLTRGHTKSCGCRRANNPLEGKKFWYLTAIERVEPPESDHGKVKQTWYRCMCDCGRETIVRGHLLISGHTKSCGKCDAFTDERIEAIRSSGTFVDGTQPCKLTCKPTKANKSGIVGVNWDKSRGKWQASIRFRGHKYNLGRFASKFEAAEIRKIAEDAIFGDFLEWYEKYKNGEAQIPKRAEEDGTNNGDEV